MLSLILAILGLVLGFFMLELGIILEVITFFIAINQRKKKEKYSNYAYYISLIVGILQVVVWVIGTAYAFIAVHNITSKADEELDAIRKRAEVLSSYSEICSEKIDINNYNSYEDYNKAYNECTGIIDACFDENDDLDDAKKCADKIKE